jgi:hypothetical protein
MVTKWHDVDKRMSGDAIPLPSHRYPENQFSGQKERSREKVAGIPLEMLRRVMGNMRGRLEECLRRNGGHLEDIIFKK